LEDSPAKVVLFGARSPQVFIAWISENSGVGGSALAPNYLGGGSSVGYGFACAVQHPGDEPKPFSIKILVGNFPDAVKRLKEPTVPAITTEIVAAMKLARATLIISEDQACQPKPNLTEK
jgi:hypothetical protein